MGARGAELAAYLMTAQNDVEKRFAALLGELGPQAPLAPALREALLPAGKCLRPALMFLVGDLVGLKRDRLIASATALEMIHAASLALDDLPCMDMGVMRRGRPALHLSVGQPLAVLAAVTLVVEAFGSMARGGASRAAMIAMGYACGADGLAAGQALDMAGGVPEVDATRLERVHRLKTASLFEAAVAIPLLEADVDPLTMTPLEQYASCVGVAFQIADDIRGGDNAKISYRSTAPNMATLLGVDGARQRLAELTQRALCALQSFGPKADLLRELAMMVEERGA